MLVMGLAGVASATTFDLIAGGGNIAGARDVGDVDVTISGTTLYVTYTIVDQTPNNLLDNWYLTETHVAVAASPDGIPQKNQNPIPGQFPKADSATHDYATQYTEAVDISGFPCGSDLVVAIHAKVVTKGGVGAVCSSLPQGVTLEYFRMFGPDAYFQQLILGGGTWLDGTYKGWCVDVEHGFNIGWPYTWSQVFCSYDPNLPAWVVANPGNLDSVNWILNQNLVGMTGPTGVPITFGDVQKAIWFLVEDSDHSEPAVLPWTQENVDWIVAQALANDGFKPAPGQYMGIIIAQVFQNDVIAQTVLVPIRVPCGMDETAWGAVTAWENGKMTAFGYPFLGKNWATYVTVPNPCPVPP